MSHQDPGADRSQRASPPVILVVEDDPSSREALSRFVDLAGYATLAADSGEAALRILEERDDVALVLCDVMMPGINGIEFYAAARRRRKGLKIVLVTGDSQSADDVIASGAIAVLKPYDFDILKRVIADELEKAPDA